MGDGWPVRPRWLACVLLRALVLVAVVVVVGRVITSSTPRLGTVLLFTVTVAAVTAAWGRSRRLVVSDQGVTIRGEGQTKDVAWADIEQVSRRRLIYTQATDRTESGLKVSMDSQYLGTPTRLRTVDLRPYLDQARWDELVRRLGQHRPDLVTPPASG